MISPSVDSNFHSMTNRIFSSSTMTQADFLLAREYRKSFLDFFAKVDERILKRNEQKFDEETDKEQFYSENNVANDHLSKSDESSKINQNDDKSKENNFGILITNVETIESFDPDKNEEKELKEESSNVNNQTSSIENSSASNFNSKYLNSLKNDKEFLKKHLKILKTLKSVKEVECPVCSKVISDKNYKFHIARHKYSEFSSGYKCSRCEITFRTKFGRQQHSRRVHGVDHEDNDEITQVSKEMIGKFKCQECKGVFSLISYRVHMKLHREKKLGVKYECKMCNKNFSSRKTVFQHLRRIHKVNENLTDFILVNKKIINNKAKKLLTDNQKANEAVKNSLKCHQCALTFSTINGFKKHTKRVHQPGKKVKFENCEKCSRKNFPGGGHELYHQLSDEGKCLKCKNCEFVTLSAWPVSVMRTHFKNFHNNSKVEYEIVEK